MSRCGWRRGLGWPWLCGREVAVLVVVVVMMVSDRITITAGDEWLVLDLASNLGVPGRWLVRVPVGVAVVAWWVWWGRRRAMRAPDDVDGLMARWGVPAPRPGRGGDDR